MDECYTALKRLVDQFSLPAEGWIRISVAFPSYERAGKNTWFTLPVSDEARDAVLHARDILGEKT